MTPKFQPGDRVRIRMMSAQTLIKLTPENQVVFVNETHDVGVGTVVRLVPRDEVCVPESEYGRLYYVSVERGRFDAHRNDLGDLAAWEWEMESLKENSDE